ncbi:hypothetical protein [Pseudozobellia thermophila]|uniref:Uncharacterized protein n=1 Tax=Pseudozobellia thermophila TaxID=192903 RepID=A0A1M6HCW4_9FLAO|nr:hypothetical protein [Pseudozobellia thermophila]SHJ20057.1 hypothetical protein SAMN04488513_1034 [Pseudozobellia thermophila]
MTINWIVGAEADENLKRYCVDFEYRLRPKITKYLISRLDPDYCSDFSCFQFDVDLPGRCIRLSDKTPSRYYCLLEPDFEREIDFNTI